MASNVDNIIGKLNPARRKKVEVRAAQLIAEEITLRELRYARKQTQVKMARKTEDDPGPRPAGRRHAPA